MSIIEQSAENAAQRAEQVAQNAVNKRKAAEFDKINNKVAIDGLAARIAEARPSTTNEYDVRAYINRGGSPTGTVDYGNDPDTQARLRELNANKQRYGSISEGIR